MPNIRKTWTYASLASRYAHFLAVLHTLLHSLQMICSSLHFTKAQKPPNALQHPSLHYTILLPHFPCNLALYSNLFQWTLQSFSSINPMKDISHRPALLSIIKSVCWPKTEKRTFFTGAGQVLWRIMRNFIST